MSRTITPATAEEVVRQDASYWMRHSTTSDLSARLMCRVGFRELTLLLAHYDQLKRAHEENLASRPAQGLGREEIASHLDGMAAFILECGQGVYGAEQEDVAALQAASAILRLGGQEEGWRPIETAPTTTNEPVLLIGRYPTGNAWSDVYHCWSQPPYGEGWTIHHARWPHSFPPTHWRPLPPPPATGEKEAGR